MRSPDCFAFLALALPCVAFAALPDVTLPSTPWKLTFATDDVTLRTKEYKPGSGGGSFLFSRKDGVSINVFIEPAKDCKGAEECRDKLWKLLQAKLDGTEKTAQGQLGEAYTIDVFVPKIRNLPVHDKTLYAEVFRDGFGIDVRVAKGGFRPDDQAKLEALVQSMRFEPKP